MSINGQGSAASFEKLAQIQKLQNASDQDKINK